MPTQGFSTLSALNEDARRLIQDRPRFAQVLQYALEQAFPRLDPNVDAHHLLVQDAPDVAPTSLYHLLARYLSDGREPTLDQARTALFTENDANARTPLKGITPLGLERFIKQFADNLLAQYIEQLNHYWQGQAGSTRLQLGALRKQMLKAEAQLRQQDGTLGPASQRLIAQVVNAPAMVQRMKIAVEQRVVARSVLIQTSFSQLDIPVTAACVLGCDHPASPQVILYTALFGLEEFDSMSALEATLLERLAGASGQGSLRAFIAHESKPPALLTLRFAVIDESLFESLIDEQLNKQLQDIRHAFKQARNDGSARNLEHLARQLDTSADLLPMFDLTYVNRTRLQLLWLNNLPTWLKDAPPTRQAEWLQALRAHSVELARFSDTNPPIAEYGQHQTLLDHARDELVRRLEAINVVGLDPDRVVLNTTSASQTGAHFWSSFFAPSSYTAVVSRRYTGELITLAGNQCTLTQLALENLALLDADFWLSARLTDLNGAAITRITPSEIRTLIRELDFANHYDQMLKSRLLDAPQAPTHKAHFKAELRARMRLDALEALLGGDLAQADYQWITAQLQAQSIQAASQLFLVGFPVQGVIAFTLADGLILYTPEAEKHPRFKRHASELHMLKALGMEPWHRYLAARLPHEHQAAALRDLASHPAGDLPKTLTARRVTEELFEVQYLLQVTTARDNARIKAHSTLDIHLRDLKTAFFFALDTISFVLPFKFMIPLALTRSLWATFKCIQALHEQDRNAALQHFLEALTHLLDVSTDVAGSSLMSRHKTVPANHRLDLRYALDKPPAGLKLRTDEHYQGIYELQHTDGRPAQYFLEQAGRYFEGKRQPHNDAWHILNPRNPTGSIGQPVKRAPDGQWQPTWVDRLPGGNDNLVQDVISQYRARNVSLQGLAPDDDGIYRIGSQLYIYEAPHAFNVLRHGPGEIQIRSSVAPFALLPRRLRRNTVTGTWEMKLDTLHVLWKPLLDEKVHFDWDDGPVDELKDQPTLRVLKTVLPDQGKQAVETLLKSFNMIRTKRQRLAQDITATGQIPPWALDHRAQSMNVANPERFADLKPLISGMLETMRQSSGFYPSATQRKAVANFSRGFLDAFAEDSGYRFNSQNSLYRTDVQALLRGDGYAPAEFAATGGLRITPGSHTDPYIEAGAIPASVNHRDAQTYANNLDESNLIYNSQESDYPAARPNESPSSPGSPRDPDSPKRLNQRHGFLYLLDTRGYETVGVADNVIFNTRESHLSGGVVGSEVHLGAAGGRFPANRMWLMHSDNTKAVRLDKLNDQYSATLHNLKEETYAGHFTRSDHDQLIERMPLQDQLPVSFDAHGVIHNPFASVAIPPVDD
jgi:hypothetical protein